MVVCVFVSVILLAPCGVVQLFQSVDRLFLHKPPTPSKTFSLSQLREPILERFALPECRECNRLAGE